MTEPTEDVRRAREWLHKIAKPMLNPNTVSLGPLTEERLGEILAAYAAAETERLQRKLDEIKATGYACGLFYGMKAPFVGGCGKEVLQHESYRCADCMGSFHRECINKHFELDAYVKALRDERLQQPIKDWKEAVKAAEAERDRLRKDLKTYGNHDKSCQGFKCGRKDCPCVIRPCTCGFEAALQDSAGG